MIKIDNKKFIDRYFTFLLFICIIFAVLSLSFYMLLYNFDYYIYLALVNFIVIIIWLKMVVYSRIFVFEKVGDVISIKYYFPWEKHKRLKYCLEFPMDYLEEYAVKLNFGITRIYLTVTKPDNTVKTYGYKIIGLNAKKISIIKKKISILDYANS